MSADPQPPSGSSAVSAVPSWSSCVCSPPSSSPRPRSSGGRRSLRPRSPDSDEHESSGESIRRPSAVVRRGGGHDHRRPRIGRQQHGDADAGGRRRRTAGCRQPPTMELREQTVASARWARAQDIGNSTYHAVADIPFAGTWEVSVDVRTSTFDSGVATTEFVVPGLRAPDVRIGAIGSIVRGRRIGVRRRWMRCWAP